MLILVDSLRRGGAERLIVTTLEHLDRSRFRPQVVSLFGPGPLASEIRELGIPVTELELRGPSRLLGALASVRAMIRDEEIEVVHTHLFFSNIVGRLAAGRRVPVVTTLHNPDYGQEGPTHGLGLRRMIDGSTALLLRPTYLAVSRDVERDYRKHLALDRVQVLYNYMDVGAFRRRLTAVDRNQARQSLGVGQDEWAVLHTGRLHRQKGQDILLEAFARLKQQVPEAVLLLAGEGPDLSSLVARIGELGLAGSVRLLGDVEDVPRLYRAADAFAFPSRYEAFGISLLEAMCAGLPAVVSAVGGITEVTAPDSALFVPVEDPEALACALVRIARDRVLAGRLSERARERAEGFDVSVWLPRLEDVYAAA